MVWGSRRDKRWRRCCCFGCCVSSSLSGRRSVEAERRSFWLAVSSWVDTVCWSGLFDDDDSACWCLDGLDVLCAEELECLCGLL